MTRSCKNYGIQRIRRGLAPLELVLILPFIAALMVLIFYVEHAGVDQLELSENLHYQTMRLRYDKQPCDITPLVYKKATQGELDGDSNGQVRSGLIYDKWEHKTTSRAQFYANAWTAASKWGNESYWANHKNKKANFGRDLTENEKEENNENIFYNQKAGKIYYGNLHYYGSTVVTKPIRNTDYVDPTEGTGLVKK